MPESGQVWNNQEPGFCPECGADIDPEWVRCWLCEAKLEPLPRRSAKHRRRPQPVTKRESTSSIVITTVVLGAVAGVWLGVALSKPGLGFLLAVGMLPATVRTLIVVRRRQSDRKATTTLEAACMFMTSLLVTGMLLVSTFFTAAGVLLFGLLSICGMQALPSRGTAITMGALLFATALSFLGWGFWTNIRARFHDDVSKL